MAYTGGKLNFLNGKYAISAPDRSVPVIKLIRAHRPGSKDELCALIEAHHQSDCTCGIKSRGTIEGFGKKLYKAQFKEWRIEKYSLQECTQWEYDLFIIQSLKGTLVENKALLELSKRLPKLTIKEAEGYVDEELRIDLIVTENGKEKFGIQVKPLTFELMRAAVIDFNKTANAKWGNPVFYLYYDDDENFTNMEETIDRLQAK